MSSSSVLVDTNSHTRSASPNARDEHFAPDRGNHVTERVVNSQPTPIIALCHLQWDWVWQRPQQFLSRFSVQRPVLFVETHCSNTAVTTTRTRRAQNHPGVTILEVHLPASRWSDGSFIDSERRRILQDRLTGELGGRFDQAVLWFNDPMAVTAYAGHLNERMIVYDCMDELTQFQGAPPQLREREIELTRRANVIFCGGRKMREKRLILNPNTHFFGTGVDVEHFGAAGSSDLEVDPEIAALQPPVLGYFGVVDERIDYGLLTALADARDDWSIAMVGPVAKVLPELLPRRSNLHFLGGRPYQRLPAITKGFAACLMPFALNAATEFINPTKALEYMAAGKPVISTAIAEVRSNCADVCSIAETPEEFIKHCEREAAAPNPTRIQRGLELARRNTWESIAAQMMRHIDRFLAEAPEARPTPIPAQAALQSPSHR